MARPPKKLTTKQRLIAFAPALVVVGITAITASGMSIVNPATAATSSDSVDVVGQVVAGFSTPVTPDGMGCGDVAGTRTLQMGATWAGAAPVASIVGGGANTCFITFATSGLGAQATYENVADDVEPFCNDPAGAPPRSCAAGNVPSVTPGAPAPNQAAPLTANTFGLALTAVSGGAAGNLTTAGADVAAANAAPAAGDDVWTPIVRSSDPARELCTIGGPNPDPGDEAVCSFAVGVLGTTATPIGDYSASINFTVQTP